MITQIMEKNKGDRDYDGNNDKSSSEPWLDTWIFNSENRHA